MAAAVCLNTADGKHVLRDDGGAWPSSDTHRLTVIVRCSEYQAAGHREMKVDELEWAEVVPEEDRGKVGEHGCISEPLSSGDDAVSAWEVLHHFPLQDDT
jgi:hypothetical protein